MKFHFLIRMDVEMYAFFKFFLKIFIIMIALVSSPFVAAENRMKTYSLIGFDSFCGLPVYTGYNPQIATAEIDINGQPIIHIDPSAFNNQSHSRLFVLAHECAHHKLGHTSQFGKAQRFYGGTRQQELDADCWAAKQLKKYGFFNDINYATFVNIANGFFTGNGYPSGVERAKNIQECAGFRFKSQNTALTPKNVCNIRKVPKVNTVFRTQIINKQVHCSHIVYTPFGPRPMHAFDIIPQAVQVPVTVTTMVHENFCE